MDLTKLFRQAVQGNQGFTESLSIIRQNSSGNAWLIGGSVYRALASCLYDAPKQDCDMDFIIEHAREPKDIQLPPGWMRTENHFGNPKFTHHQRSIDYVPLQSIHSIRSWSLPLTIDGYLEGAPLTIQSIAYDLQTRKIIGDVGINALLTKTVAVNNRDEAHYTKNKKGIPTLEAYIQQTATSLGFTAIMNMKDFWKLL